MHHQEASEGSGFQAFQKGVHGKLNPEIDFTITFDPDIDEFIASIVRDNKMYSSDTLDYLKEVRDLMHRTCITSRFPLSQCEMLFF